MNTTVNSVSANGIVSNYISVLKSYANFSGRARRSEYWHFMLANFVVSFAVGFVVGLISPTVASFLSMVYTLATLVPAIALCIRRMHDVDKSGWFALIPIYNFILAITEGTQGANQYGLDPKAVASAKTVESVV